MTVGTTIKIPKATAAPSKNANVVETGDVVKITGKNYYSGAAIPTWVRAKTWVVYSAKSGSDKVIIDKSADGKNAIMSPINRKDLAVVRKKK